MTEINLQSQKKKMLGIINDLQKNMNDLNSLKREIQTDKVDLIGSPKNGMALLEEIIVPPLELIKEKSEKN